MNSPSVPSLLALLSHEDADVRRQGRELLHTLHTDVLRGAFSMAVSTGQLDIAAIIAVDDVSRCRGLQQRFWAAAAGHLCRVHRDAHAPLPADVSHRIWALESQDSNAHQSTHMTAECAQQDIVQHLHPHIRAGAPPFWKPPADWCMTAQAQHMTTVTALQDGASQHLVRTMQTRAFPLLKPWSSTAKIIQHCADLAVLNLPHHPSVEAGLQQQLEHRTDPQRQQRLLCHQLATQQRSMAAKWIDAALREHSAFWVEMLHDVVATEDSRLFD